MSLSKSSFILSNCPEIIFRFQTLKVLKTFRVYGQVISRRPLSIIPALLLVSLLGWFAARQYETARQVVYVIPPGVGSGQVTLDVPDEIILTLGIKDTIVIENQDEVVHRFGPFIVAPRTTMTQRFYHPVQYEGVCTFHREQQMRLVVKPALRILYPF